MLALALNVKHLVENKNTNVLNKGTKAKRSMCEDFETPSSILSKRWSDTTLGVLKSESQKL